MENISITKEANKTLLTYRFGYNNMNRHTIEFGHQLGEKKYPFICQFSFKVNADIVHLLESSGILVIDPDFSTITERESSMYIVPKTFYTTEKFLEVLADLFDKFNITHHEP